MFKKHLAFFIAFPIGCLLLLALIIFYFDLANGPVLCFIYALLNLAALITLSILFINKKMWMRLTPWAGFVFTLVLLISLAKPTVEIKSAAYYSNPVEISNPLTLNNGKVKGIYNKDQDVEIYAGIPFAEAPVGDLRWKEPVPVHDWEGVKDCTKFAARAMQVDTSPVINSLVDIYAEKGWHPDYTMHPLQNMSEDCLYLNIWRPKNVSNAPILVFIHGGSLTTGSGAFESYNGEALAKKGIIMITIQYRLGVFGYFAHPSLMDESVNKTTGNYGLLDQIEAVKWVYENAEKFGGDKSKITIAGESAGSSSVSALCVTPLLRGTGIINNAIGESSSIVGRYPPHTFRKLESAYEAGEKILKEFKCKSIDELRKIPADKLVKTSVVNSSMTLDGYALDQMPNEIYKLGLNNEKALLNGYNVKEADAFVIPNFLLSPTNKDNIKSRLADYMDEETATKIVDIYKDKIEIDATAALNEIMSVYWFMYPHYEWSNLAAANGETVYRYEFTKENGYNGTYHSGEMIYCYNNIEKSGHSFAYNDSDYKLADIMSDYWVNFVKTGDPNGGDLEPWYEYVPGNERVMELGENLGMKDESYQDMYQILKDFVPKEYKEN